MIKVKIDAKGVDSSRRPLLLPGKCMYSEHVLRLITRRDDFVIYGI